MPGFLPNTINAWFVMFFGIGHGWAFALPASENKASPSISTSEKQGMLTF